MTDGNVENVASVGSVELGVYKSLNDHIAAELERLARDIEPGPPEYSSADYHDAETAAFDRGTVQAEWSIVALLRRRISELRGETVE